MDKLKNYLVPLVGLAVLGVWFFAFKPQMDDADGDANTNPNQQAATTGKPVVVPLDPLVEGDLGAPLVREVVEGHVDDLLACYVEGLGRTPGIHGRVMLQIIIRPEGTVRAADIAGSQVKDEAVGRCLTEKAATWEFPVSDGGGSTRVTYPLQLQVEPG